MLRDGLSEQLRRIGLITAIAVMSTAALATFALLTRFVPRSTTPPIASRTMTPSQHRLRIRPVTAPAGGASGAADPLATAQGQTEHDIARTQHLETVLARRQAKVIRRNLRQITRESRSHPTSTITVHRHGAASAPGQSGGATVAPAPLQRLKSTTHKGP